MFVPAVDLQDQIEKAIMSMPNKKAAGPDLVIDEAMKTAHEHQAGFLANLWRVVGRTEQVPTQWNKCTTVPLYKKGDLRNLATTAQSPFSCTRYKSSRKSLKMQSRLSANSILSC